jgi:hypothetical protein
MTRKIQRFAVGLAIGVALCGCGGTSLSTGGGGGGGGGSHSATLVQLGMIGATYSGGNWVVAGEGGFTLLANGTGFTPTSVIQWNGAPLTTQMARQLTSMLRCRLQ